MATLALIDPAGAAAAVEDRDRDRADSMGRLQLAKLLVAERDVLWRSLRAWLALWSIDTEDLAEL